MSALTTSLRRVLRVNSDHEATFVFGLVGEEALQLIERGVPVWDLLAKATGRNVQELQKMSEAGQLGRDVILQLIDAMGRQNAGATQ